MPYYCNAQCIRKGLFVPPPVLDTSSFCKSPLFKDFCEQYLEYSKANKKSYERDVSITKALLRFFAGNRLSSVTPLMIERYKHVRLEWVTKSTVNRELACLRHMFNMTIKWGKADKNPVQEVKPYGVENQRERILTLNEIGRLLACSTGHTRAIIAAALNTGMRLREILNLTGEDVDLRQGKIVVRNTKTCRVRKIPINTTAREVLLGIERMDSPYVFPDPRTGKPYSNIRTSFATALKRAGISKMWFHDLRHTAATYMVLNGIDLVTVREVLGHSRMDTTLRYSHPTPQSKCRAVEVLGKLTTGVAVSRNSVNKLTTNDKENDGDFLETWQDQQRERNSLSSFI